MAHHGPLTLNIMQRRYWSQEEDHALRNIVTPMPEINWTLVSLRMRVDVEGCERNAKQCRERWLNKLNRGDSDDLPWHGCEDKIILQQFIRHHRSEKNKWIIIAEKLNKCQKADGSGRKGAERTANEIKNRFYSIVRKGIRRINNKLGRPILPEEVRLIKPITISKLFQSFEESQCRDMLEVLYGISMEDEGSNKLEIPSSKLQALLDSIINLNRSQQKPRSSPPIPEQKPQPPAPRQPLKKRKSSLSTVEQQKSQLLNRSTKLYLQHDPVQELDIIDLFISDYLYVQDSVSVQFEEIDFGI